MQRQRRKIHNILIDKTRGRSPKEEEKKKDAPVEVETCVTFGCAGWLGDLRFIRAPSRRKGWHLGFYPRGAHWQN